MEQQFNTPYPPLVRAPLKMRGVFGVAWELYRRGFWQMFALAMLLLGLLMFILMLAMFSMLQQTGILGEMQNDFAQFGNMAASDFINADFPIPAMLFYMGVLLLLPLLLAFLLIPAYNGAAYMEMDQRMEGRSGSLYQLLKYALPIGLKRFYTTFLALYVVKIAASIVINIFISISVTLTLSTLFSLAASDWLTSGSITPIVLSVLITVFLGALHEVFTALVYPVAAHEGKRAFDAVLRSFKLACKRFGRLLGAVLLYALIVGVLTAVVVCLPILLLMQNTGRMLVAFAIVYSVWFALVMPYMAAFNTALYVDAAARVDGAAARAAIPPMQPQLAQPGLGQTVYPPPHPEMPRQPEAQPQQYAQPHPGVQSQSGVQSQPGVQLLPESWVDTGARRDEQPKQ